MAPVGVPGKCSSGTPAMRPCPCGPPGRIDRRRNVEWSSPSSCLTTSKAPALIPPVVMIRSTLSRSSSTICRKTAGSSPQLRSTGIAPAAAIAELSMGRFELWMNGCDEVAESVTSSSPVTMRPMVSGRRTRMVSRPIIASVPTPAELITSPAVMTVSPLPVSSPLL